MNKAIYKQLIAILFFSFPQIFFGEIKGKEICYFSNVKEYGECLKLADRELKPKYPFNPQDNMHFYWLGGNTLPLSGNYGKIYKVLNLSSNTGNEINVTLGEKKNTIWNSIGGKFISKKDFIIKKEEIIGWKYSNFNAPLKENGPVYNLELNYLDSLGSPHKIAFKAYFGTGPYDVNRVVIYEFLKDLSKLDNGEIRNIREMQTSQLERYEKDINIISSIIKTSQKEFCFDVDYGKFPELIKKYQILFNSISPLRTQLDLPPTTDFKPICN